MDKPPPNFDADRDTLQPGADFGIRPIWNGGSHSSDLDKPVAVKRDRQARGVIRPLPAYSVFPSNLLITPEEIHKVLAALGPDLAALFEE